MSLQPYPAYQPSGIEWLGDVPGHWQRTQTKRVCRFTTGWTPPTGDESSYEGENLWANISDLGPKSLEDTGKRISDSAVEKIGLAVSPTGSLLFSFKLSIGQVSFAGRDMFTNEAIATFHESEAVSLSFAYYAFPVFLVKNSSENIYGAKLLNQELIKNAQLSLPPKEEQVAIASFLDRETAKIDALIAEQEKLLALLAEKRQATISHAVTRGLNPQVATKDSGIEWLGKIPEHWSVAPLKVLASVQTGIAKGKDVSGKTTINVPYLRVANVQNGYLDLDEIATLDIEPEQLGRYRLQPGDVLMNEGGDFDKLGRGAVWASEIEDCIHQNHVFAVRPHGISSRWLAQVTCANYAQFYFMSRSKQSTNLASISSTSIMELPVVVPPRREQDEIVDFLLEQGAKHFALMSEAERGIELLKERRDALIAAAVTGKVDVRGAA